MTDDLLSAESQPHAKTQSKSCPGTKPAAERCGVRGVETLLPAGGPRYAGLQPGACTLLAVRAMLQTSQ
jgi:hypothetical protein